MALIRCRREGRLQPLCYNKGPQDAQNPTAKACGRNSTTGERLEGWNVAMLVGLLVGRQHAQRQQSNSEG